MIMIRESAPFRKDRDYCYEIKREKLDNPISVDAGTPFEVSYRTTVRAVRNRKNRIQQSINETLSVLRADRSVPQHLA